MAGVKTYDPSKVVVSFNGQRLQGFSEDSMVKVTWSSPTYEKVVSADGKTTRVRILDDGATVAISLMQSSDSNKTLAAIHKRDRIAPNGQGVGTLIIADLNGETLVHSDSAWIKSRPEIEFGKKVNSRTWEIDASDVTMEDSSLEGS